MLKQPDAESQPFISFREMYPEATVVVDNGKDRVIVPVLEMYNTLLRVIEIDADRVASALMQAVMDYIEEVKSGREKGIAVGSSDLAIGISSAFYAGGSDSVDPTRFGLQTAQELRFVAEIIELQIRAANPTH